MEINSLSIGSFLTLQHLINKRDSTIEKQSPLILKGFHDLLEANPLYHDWMRSLNPQKG